MWTMEGYGTIVSSKPIKDIHKTTIYKKIKSFFLPDEAIHIDVLSGKNSPRPQLEKLLKQMTAGDIFVFATIKSLGSTDKEIRNKWHEIVLQRNMNVLIPDYTRESGLGDFSTCDFGGTRVSNAAIEEMWKQLQKTKFERLTSTRGRKKIAFVNEQFLKAYWRYQNFFISTDQAVGESGLSRQTFYRLSKEYESSDEYRKELLRQADENQIQLKPKRGGGEPECLQQILFDVENLKKDLQSVCAQYEIEMNQVEYERFKLLYLTGKKGLADAMEQYGLEQNSIINSENETVPKIV